MVQPVTLTDEQRRSLENGTAVRVTEPETRLECVMIRADVFERVKSLLSDLDPREAYAALDESFRAGWIDPQMAEYDDYESRQR